MKVELLYFEGCPSWRLAEQRLREALDAVGLGHTAIEHVVVDSAAGAESARFLGSPSIRVDGRDLFGAGDEQVGLACRVYSTDEGLSGAPATARLIEVLT